MTELVSALCSCVGDQRREVARRFLQGLSADELQFIADFLGSCILEANEAGERTRWQLADEIARFERCRRAGARSRKSCRRPSASLQDGEHKMILLLEYLERCGFRRGNRAANG